MCRFPAGAGSRGCPCCSAPYRDLTSLPVRVFTSTPRHRSLRASPIPEPPQERR